MIDTTQQERPFDDIIDDIMLKAERYNWSKDKLRYELFQAEVPEELIESVITFYI